MRSGNQACFAARARSSSVSAKYSERWNSSKSGKPYRAWRSASETMVRFLSRARTGTGTTGTIGLKNKPEAAEFLYNGSNAERSDGPSQENRASQTLRGNRSNHRKTESSRSPAELRVPQPGISVGKRGWQGDRRRGCAGAPRSSRLGSDPHRLSSRPEGIGTGQPAMGPD